MYLLHLLNCLCRDSLGLGFLFSVSPYYYIQSGRRVMSGGERRRISKWDLEDGSERVHQPSSVDDDFQKKSRELDKNRDSESNFNAGSNNDPKSHVGGEAYNEFGGEVSDASMPWESDTRISPSGGDDLKQRRPNRSRRRSRSRSRSPASDFNRESKSYVRSSERPQHYDKKNSEDRKRYSGGGTQRDEEASGYYAVSDDSWENPSQIGRFATITIANSNSNVCNNFLKGRCFRGESCRYSHHNVVVSGDGISKGSSDESLKARELVRRNRGGDIQCKFYAAGNCRNGKLCRFSHDDVSQDDWKVRGGKNMDQEREPNLHMDNRSRAHAVEIDRAEQRKESGYNHQHRRHPLAKETSRGRMEVSDSKGAENSVMEDNNEFSEHLNVETGLPFMSHYSSVAQKKPNFDDKHGSIDHNFSSAASVPETPSLDLNNHQNSSALFGLNPVGQNQQPIAASLRAPVEELDPGTKNTVSREQLSQLTNLSVSLAQFFGSGQQLPLLYAALNGSNSAAAAVPNQPQTEYLPVTEAVDLSKPNTTRDEPNKKPTDAVDETMLSEKKKDKAGGGPAEKLDGDGKDNNNGKGTRAFKFALVEFVKELLKPTWKEGQLSKEDHKTIVKKVVDKVTGSIHGVHIPQSQEKIDNYLSSSKPKLSKLVQAYVEKYKKS